MKPDNDAAPPAKLGDGAELKAALTEAHKLVNDLIAAEMSPLGVNMGEGDVLTVLLVAEHDPSPSEVADWLSVTGASTTARLKQLEGRGLINRKINPHDRRSVSLHLTPEGRALAIQVIEAKNATMVGAIIDQLGARDADQLTRSLRRTIEIARDLLSER